MMIFLYGILGFIILVFFHELGHFLAARSVGIKVDVFAIGMGPTLIQRTYKGTVYKLCLIPLGGYCAIKGQDDFGSIDRNKDPDSFFGKNALARFWVIIAGPLFSFLLGYFLISSALITNGETRLKYTLIDPSYESQFLKPQDKIISINNKQVEYWDDIQIQLIHNIGNTNKIVLERQGKQITIPKYSFNPNETDPLKGDFLIFYRQGPTIIQKVLPNSQADKVGLTLGDIIININGEPIRTEIDVVKYVSKSPKKINMIIHRYPNIKDLIKSDPQFFLNKNNKYETIKLTMIPTINPETKKPVIGIGGFYTYPGIDVEKSQIHRSIGFIEGFQKGFSKSGEMIALNAKGIWKLLQGNKIILDGLSGPVRIFYQVGKLSESNGAVIFFHIIGVISIALAFFNLLPIPALDGGHIFIIIIEAIKRKPINIKILNTVQLVGISLLLLLFLFVTFRDISSLFF